MKKIVVPISAILIAILLFTSFLKPKEIYPIPAASKFEPIEMKIDVNKPMVAITFDDGPHSVVTNEILDVLEQYQAHATFFIIGDRISHHTDVIRRIVELGCELGNHTYGHLDLSRMNQQDMNEQIKISEDTLASFVDSGFLPKLVRPPFGNTSETLLKNCPYPIITWSIDTRDWSHQNAERSFDEVVNHVQDGDIILMHDMYPATAKATKKIVQWLNEQGYQMVTVSEMFEAKGISLTSGKVYRHAH